MFKIAQQDQNIDYWTGDPDCDAAHAHLLAQLSQSKIAFLPNATYLSNNQKGNIGEFISLVLGKASHPNGRYSVANAFTPFANHSRSGVDLIWVLFAEKEQDDVVVLQEVKTTGNKSLALGDELIEDYTKLFGTNPDLTLQSRLHRASNDFEGAGVDSALCARIDRIAGISPKTCSQIRLRPTLVHERNGTDPKSKLVAIRSTLVSQGWDGANVGGCSVALSDLDDRLLRIACGIK